jgi:excisionase family DNA binding protein
MSERRVITRAEGERLVIAVDEAAHLLGISRSLAYELCARGELPTIRLGRRLVVPKRALFKMIENVDATWSTRPDPSGTR